MIIEINMHNFNLPRHGLPFFARITVSFPVPAPSHQPIGLELPGCARDEDFEDGDRRYREQHPGEVEQDAAAHDPDHHHERVKFDRATEDERFVKKRS